MSEKMWGWVGGSNSHTLLIEASRSDLSGSSLDVCSSVDGAWNHQPEIPLSCVHPRRHEKEAYRLQKGKSLYASNKGKMNKAWGIHTLDSCKRG